MSATKLALQGVLILLALAPSLSQARMVHDFDCTFCHLEYTSEEVPYMTYNVCLDCHYPGNEGTTYQLESGEDSNPISATFAAGDGSNAMGSNAAPGSETSHFFAGSTEENAAAGATRPANRRFNLGWANGQIACSRCHNPHGDNSNSKLLVLGVNSTDAMCLDCHQDWNVAGNHGGQIQSRTGQFRHQRRHLAGGRHQGLLYLLPRGAFCGLRCLDHRRPCRIPARRRRQASEVRRPRQ
jgi:predicted CXXCH cytochrome family protein